MLSKLHEKDALDNTIIIFLALPPENASESSMSPIESNIRRVAFVYSKKLLSHQQSVSNQLIHISDILPTLVEAAQLQWHTKDRIFIDGVTQWKVLNDNDENNARTSIFGDNFYIDNYWKLCYGTSSSIIYDSINNQYMESVVTDDNYDFNTYVDSITSSDVHELFEDITTNKIMLLRHRAKVHCNRNDINDSIVMNIKCSRTSPCLFELQTDPCEFDDMHDHEYDLRRDHMMEVFEKYLNSGVVNVISFRNEYPSDIDNHHTNSSDEGGEEEGSHVIGDPILTPSGGIDAFLTLGLALIVFLGLFVIVVCVKERCNSRRSVYIDKPPKKVTFKDESGVDAHAVPSISASVHGKTNSH